MQATSKKRVLIIEDDPNIVDLLEIHLNDLDCSLDRAGDGETGLSKAMQGDYQLIILDLMLPKLDGFEVCKRIRERNKQTPILMLTSKSEELDKVLGLELGADDYLTKPFSIRELIARIKAIFRRVEADRAPTGNPIQAFKQLRFGDLVIFPEKRKVTLSGKNIDLTAKEFDLLKLFTSHPGWAYSRQDLLDQVWGYRFDGYDHTVNSHINRLRSKIEPDPSNPIYIKTVWGIGYSFVEPEELET